MSCQEPNQLLVKSAQILETEDGNRSGNRPFEDAQVEDDPPSMDAVLASLEKGDGETIFSLINLSK